MPVQECWRREGQGAAPYTFAAADLLPARLAGVPLTRRSLRCVQGDDGLEDEGTFEHAHKDLRSQLRKGTYTAAWKKSATDWQLESLSMKYN